MRRLMTGMAALGGILWFSPAAAAQTRAELEARLDDLAKQVVALKESRAVADEEKPQETRQAASQISADATKYAGDFKIVWDDGVWFRSTDPKFALHVGGRFLVDWDWVRAPGIERDRPAMGQGLDLTGNRPNPLSFRDGVEERSIRLLAEGTLYRYVEFKLEVDFHAEENVGDSPLGLGAGGSDMVLRDAYIEATQLPLVGRLRVGHFKEPFGLEQQTDDLFLTFLERSTADTLVPGYNPGLMLHDAVLGAPGAERMTWAVGVFRKEALGNAVSVFSSPNGPVLRPTSDNADGQPIYSGRGYSLTARVTGLPYYEQKGARLLHLGLSYSYRKSNDDDLLRYMTRPEDHFIEFPFLDVTMQNVRNVNLFGAEAAAVLGPFSAQAEFVSAVVDNVGHFVVPEIDVTQTADRGPCFNAFYAQASYFLTGEHRPYDTASGAFTRVRPIRNFREGGGWGAVEVAARYSFIDLDREDLTTFGVENPGTLTPRGIQTFASRGELNDVTLGVNWYLNPNTKVSANYIRSCPGRIDTSSSADIFMMRFQVDF